MPATRSCRAPFSVGLVGRVVLRAVAWALGELFGLQFGGGVLPVVEPVGDADLVEVIQILR